MKKWRYSGFGMRRLLLRLEPRGVGRRPGGLADAAAADLVLRNLADRILRGDGQSVRALVARPVVRDEDGVRPDRCHDHGPQRDSTSACFGDGPLSVLNSQLGRETGMHLDAWLGILIDERTDASRLCSRQKLAHHTPSRQKQRVLLARIVDRRTVFTDVEPRPAVREIKRSLALGNRVIASALEQPRRPTMIDWLTGLRILAVAGPEDAHLSLDLFVRNARVVRDASFAGDPQFVEDLARAAEGEAARPAQRTRQILDDAPVLPCLARALHGLVDLDHAAFDLRDGPFVLFMQAPGQHDVRVTGRVIQKEIDCRVELQPFETARDEGVVGQRDLWVEADRQQRLDFTPVDLAEQLVCVDSRTGELVFLDAPDASDVPAMFGVADVASAGKLIALLSVFAAPLAVGLTDDRAVAALRPTNPAAGEHEVDGAQRVLNAIRVVLDAPRMEQEAALRRAPPLSGLPDQSLGDAAHVRGSRGRPLRAVTRHDIESHGAGIDEPTIDPAVLDHQIEHPRKDRRIPSRLHRQVQVAR